MPESLVQDGNRVEPESCPNALLNATPGWLQADLLVRCSCQFAFDGLPSLFWSLFPLNNVTEQGAMANGTEFGLTDLMARWENEEAEEGTNAFLRNEPRIGR